MRAAASIGDARGAARAAALGGGNPADGSTPSVGFLLYVGASTCVWHVDVRGVRRAYNRSIN